jgi:hypothetical protein
MLIDASHFPVTFRPQPAGREAVLLGVVSIGAIVATGSGRFVDL